MLLVMVEGQDGQGVTVTGVLFRPDWGQLPQVGRARSGPGLYQFCPGRRPIDEGFGCVELMRSTKVPLTGTEFRLRDSRGQG